MKQILERGVLLLCALACVAAYRGTSTNQVTLSTPYSLIQMGAPTDSTGSIFASIIDPGSVPNQASQVSKPAPIPKPKPAPQPQPQPTQTIKPIAKPTLKITPPPQPKTKPKPQPTQQNATQPVIAPQPKPSTTQQTYQQNKTQPTQTTTTQPAHKTTTQTTQKPANQTTTTSPRSVTNPSGITQTNTQTQQKSSIQWQLTGPSNQTSTPPGPTQTYQPELLGMIRPVVWSDAGFVIKENVWVYVWILMLGVYLLFKAMHYCCALLPTPERSCCLVQFEKAYYSFYREVIMFSLVASTLFLLSYLQVGINFREIAFTFTHFLLFWFVSGFIILMMSEIRARRWINYESSIIRGRQFADELKKQFELLSLQKKQKNLYPFIHYLVMRQEFITPSYLITLRESFKRTDFNFAEYLTRCFSQVLQRFFYLRFVTLIICIPIFLGWYFLHKQTGQLVEAIVALVLPILMLAITQISVMHLRSVYSKLQPPLIRPSDVNLQLELDAIDPFDHSNRVARPQFLGHQNDDERNSESEFGSQAIHPLDRERPSSLPDDARSWDQEAYEERRAQRQQRPFRRLYHSRPRTCCCCIHSNRHQSLFCCGKLGVSMLFALQQIIYFCFLLWGTSFVFNSVQYLYLEFDLFLVAILGVLVLFFALFIFLQMPAWLQLFTLATSIEMMKNRGIEEEVLMDMKFNSAERSLRIYQTFKLIRREILTEHGMPIQDQKGLRQILSRLLREVFDLFQARRKYSDHEFTLNTKSCEEFVRVCGSRLTQREQFVLLKSASSNEKIGYAAMSEAIEANFNDVGLNPVQVVVTVFRLYFKNKNINTLRLDDLFAFFKEYQLYFQTFDISEFLEEIKLIMQEKLDDQFISATEIGCRIRNDIERLPK